MPCPERSSADLWICLIFMQILSALNKSHSRALGGFVSYANDVELSIETRGIDITHKRSLVTSTSTPTHSSYEVLCVTWLINQVDERRLHSTSTRAQLSWAQSERILQSEDSTFSVSHYVELYFLLQLLSCRLCPQRDASRVKGSLFISS